MLLAPTLLPNVRQKKTLSTQSKRVTISKNERGRSTPPHVESYGYSMTSKHITTATELDTLTTAHAKLLTCSPEIKKSSNLLFFVQATAIEMQNHQNGSPQYHATVLKE
jgi:hypothetical protein